MKKLGLLIFVATLVFSCQPTKQEKITMLIDSVNAIQRDLYNPATSNAGIENNLPETLPRKHKAPVTLGVSNAELLEQDSIKNQKLKQCITLLDEILAIDSMHFWANGARSMVMYEMGDYGEALKNNEKLEEKYGDSIADIYYSRSLILEKMGRYEGATFYYFEGDRVLLNNIKNRPTDSNLMMSYISIGYEFDGEAEMKRRIARMERDYPQFTSLYCKTFTNADCD